MKILVITPLQFSQPNLAAVRSMTSRIVEEKMTEKDLTILEHRGIFREAPPIEYSASVPPKTEACPALTNIEWFWNVFQGTGVRLNVVKGCGILLQ